MKKNINVVLVLAIVLSMLLVNISGEVHATKIPPTPLLQSPGLAEGSWSAGTEVDVNLDAVNYAGLQLLTKGVKLSEPAKLCHEFRGGDYGWVGEIRMLKNGVWVKQPTTMGWEPDTEGKFMACTDASAVGTYALFGWFDSKSPKVRQSNLPLCNTELLDDAAYMTAYNEDQYGNPYRTTSFTFLIHSMPNTPMTLGIVKALDSKGNTIIFDSSSFTTTDYTDDDGSLSLAYLISEHDPDYLHVILTTPTCYFDLDPLQHVR
jgi:hypothetical protein